MLLEDARSGPRREEADAPFARQMRSVLAVIASAPAVLPTIAGFVLIHLAFVGLAFGQLWLVRERGFDAGSIARQIGALQILFGVLGALVGGLLSDRLANRGSKAAMPGSSRG
jgi:hypothetical protein